MHAGVSVSRRLLALALFAVLALQIAPSASQSCATLTASTCSQIIAPGTSVFVPAYFTIEGMEHYTSSLINIINYYAYPDPCRTRAYQLICGSWLRPCMQDSNGVAIPVPQEPCLNMCWTYYNDCLNLYPFGPGGFPLGLGVYFPFPSFPPLNCSNPPIDYWAGNVTFYPDGDTLVEYQGVNYTVPCSQETPIAVPYETVCPDPLIVAESEERGSQCAFTCPLPSLSEDQYDNVKILQGIMGWTSWVTTCILVLLLIFNPKTRSFPRNLVMMVACAANIAAGAIIMPTYGGYKNIWCGGDRVLVPEGEVVGVDEFFLPVFDWNTDETFLSVKSSACTFQGAMLQFGFLAAVFWWVLIAFNMTLELYLNGLVNFNTKKWKWLRFGIYLFIGWGIPFVLMVIPAAAGQIKFAPAGTYCFVTNEDNYAWSLTFWFIPVGISLVLGVILFFLAVVRLVWLLFKLKKFKKLIVLNIRLLLFVFLYLTLFVFITAYNITVANNKDKINDGYSEYYTCLIFGESGCSLPDDVSNYDLVMLKAWAISSLGTMLFLLFISWDVLVFWYNLFKAIGLAAYKKNPQILYQALTMFTASSSRSMTMTGTKGTELSLTNLDDEEEEDEEGGKKQMKKKKKDKEEEESRSGVDQDTSSSSAGED